MTNTNTNTRREYLIERREYLTKCIEQNRQFIAESRARVITSGRRMFHCFNAYESDCSVSLLVAGHGQYRLDVINSRLVSTQGSKDLCWNPLPCEVKELLVDLSLVVEELARRLDELKDINEELGRLDSEELPPPFTSLRCSVQRLDGYTADDLNRQEFECNAEINAEYVNRSGELVKRQIKDIPVIVTAPVHPWECHTVELNTDPVFIAHNFVDGRTRSETAALVSRVNLEDVKQSINCALRFADIDELEARRRCHAVRHDFELFQMLLEVTETPFDAVSEEGDELSEESREIVEAFERVTESQWPHTFDEFQDRVNAAIDNYFLEITTATPMVRGEFDPDANCVKALITVGGPYCAVHQFFGDRPEVVFSWGSTRATVELFGDSREFFDNLVEYQLC